VGKEKDKDGFRALWCRLKPADKPEAGVPFDTDDAMFSPPVVSLPRPLSQYSLETPIFAQSFSQDDLSTTPPPPERSPVRTYSGNSSFVKFYSTISHRAVGATNNNASSHPRRIYGVCSKSARLLAVTLIYYLKPWLLPNLTLSTLISFL
jgi:hypothetical protein